MPSWGRGHGGATQRRDPRHSRAQSHASIEGARGTIPRDFCIRWRIPREVTMGIRLVMRRILGGVGLFLMVVGRARVLLFMGYMGGAEMRKEHKRLVSTISVVHQDMGRGPEKGQHDATGNPAHSA